MTRTREFSQVLGDMKKISKKWKEELQEEKKGQETLRALTCIKWKQCKNISYYHCNHDCHHHQHHHHKQVIYRSLTTHRPELKLFYTYRTLNHIVREQRQVYRMVQIKGITLEQKYTVT
jgi:hypothetical protein